MSDEFSESDSPVRRYEPLEERRFSLPDSSGSSFEMIERHIKTHVGEIQGVYHEIISNLVHIDIHIVAPTPMRPYYTLITTGMSDLPMSPSKQAEECRFAELMLCLPPSWPMADEDHNNEENYWPIRWLKTLARFPHEYKTWLWHGHTIPNGDPAIPFAPNTSMCCMILAHPITVSTAFWKLQAREDKDIHFFALLPLFPDEVELKLKVGSETLLQRFEKAKYSELLDLSRRSVAANPWWKLF